MSAADPWANAPERWLLSQTYQQVAAVIGWRNAVELGTWVYENKQPPCRKARRNYDLRGQLPVSRRASSTLMRAVAAVIGETATRALQREFSGEILSFGSIQPASIPRRNRAIVEAIRSGETVKVVACAFDLGERQVRNICRSADMKSTNMESKT